MNLLPPTVVYSFQKAPGRSLKMSAIERLTFLASLMLSRYHFGNANVVADDASLRELPSFTTQLATKVIPVEVATGNLDVFWASAAKAVGLTWALQQESKSQLLLDADALIWDGTAFDWWSKDHLFIGGYQEPLTWEAYREQESRLGSIFFKAIADALSWNTNAMPEDFKATQQKLALGASPVNGAILFFNDTYLCSSYIKAIESFIAGFDAAKLQPRPFFKKQGDPSSGFTYFSEGMMADQRTLGALITLYYPQCREKVIFLEGFEPTPCGFSDYPTNNNETILHLWKLKGEMPDGSALSHVMEQYILQRLTECLPRTFVNSLGWDIHKISVPMTSTHYRKLVAIQPI